MGKSGDTDPAACAEAARICACFQTRRVARAVTRLFDGALQPVGLRSTQFVMLVAIRAHGEPELPALARGLGVDRSTLTRNLAGLEREGLLERRSTGRGRASTVRLTPEGLDALERAVPLWRKAQARFLAGTSRGDWESTLAVLGEVAALAED